MTELNQMDRYNEYSKDESRFYGEAAGIAFPETEEQTCRIVEELWEQGTPVTIQGARTGIVGAAVPQGGAVVNLEKLNRILDVTCKDGTAFVRVQAGVRLEELTAVLETGHCAGLEEASAEVLKECRYRFIPNPTETTATVGGMIGNNAGGPNKGFFGKTDAYVQELTVLTPAFGRLELKRGDCVFDGSGFTLSDGMRLEVPVSIRALPLMPREGSDLIELFSGSEGMLGVITQAVLQLEPCIAEQWGVVSFFEHIEQLHTFATLILEAEWKGVSLPVMEYFSTDALDLAMSFRETASKLQEIPDAPKGMNALYIELESDDEEEAEEALLGILELLMEAGGDEELTWAAHGMVELEKFRLLRHAVPEAANAKVDEHRKENTALHKMAADYSTPKEHVAKMIEAYETDISKSNMEGVVFGHYRDGHIHVNLMPVTEAQREESAALLKRWAKMVVGLGGSVVSENGVGKLKKELFSHYLADREKQSMRKVKDFFDPEGLLNRGNML